MIEKYYCQFVIPFQDERTKNKRVYGKFSLTPLVFHASSELYSFVYSSCARYSSTFEKHLHIAFNSTHPVCVTVLRLHSAVCWFLWLETVYSVAVSDEVRQSFITFSLLLSFLVLQGHFRGCLKSWEKSIDCTFHYLQC